MERRFLEQYKHWQNNKTILLSTLSLFLSFSFCLFSFPSSFYVHFNPLSSRFLFSIISLIFLLCLLIFYCPFSCFHYIYFFHFLPHLLSFFEFFSFLFCALIFHIIFTPPPPSPSVPWPIKLMRVWQIYEYYWVSEVYPSPSMPIKSNNCDMCDKNWLFSETMCSVGITNNGNSPEPH